MRTGFLLYALVCLASTALPAAAQVPTLDRVDSLIAAGAYQDARTTLETWWSARQTFDVPGSDRVRAMMLRAQLQPDPASAEEDYLSVVLGHPMSPHAPEALLRLGQALLAAGQSDRAAGYLQRLVADYPGKSQRLPGLLWLARAHTAARRSAAACGAAREGLLDSRHDPDMAAMLRVEEAAACRVGSAARAPAPAERNPEPGRADTSDTADRADAGSQVGAAEATQPGRFAAQAGAFRYTDGADALMERLRAAGFEPRAVRIPGSALVRVRVGRFESGADAAAMVARMRDAGFDAVRVADADQEGAS